MCPVPSDPFAAEVYAGLGFFNVFMTGIELTTLSSISFLVKPLRGLVNDAGQAAADRTIRESAEVLLLKGSRIGHSTPWSQMTKPQRKAFQHSYSRHGAELGLPKWSQKNAATLQEQFNKIVGHIKTHGTQISGVKKPFNSKSVDVNFYEATLNGTKYYYYETLQGLFISAGKSR